jgi:hypothetical protein
MEDPNRARAKDRLDFLDSIRGVAILEVAFFPATYGWSGPANSFPSFPTFSIETSVAISRRLTTNNRKT